MRGGGGGDRYLAQGEEGMAGAQVFLRLHNEVLPRAGREPAFGGGKRRTVPGELRSVCREVKGVERRRKAEKDAARGIDRVVSVYRE
jgi:hypothetical protein